VVHPVHYEFHPGHPVHPVHLEPSLNKMVSEIESNENQNMSTNEVEKVDFEIVKIADADGNSEIGIE